MSTARSQIPLVFQALSVSSTGPSTLSPLLYFPNLNSKPESGLLPNNGLPAGLQVTHHTGDINVCKVPPHGFLNYVSFQRHPAFFNIQLPVRYYS